MHSDCGGGCYAVADRFAGGEDVWANILLGFISLFTPLSFDSVDFAFGFTTLLSFFLIEYWLFLVTFYYSILFYTLARGTFFWRKETGIHSLLCSAPQHTDSDLGYSSYLTTLYIRNKSNQKSKRKWSTGSFPCAASKPSSPSPSSVSWHTVSFSDHTLKSVVKSNIIPQSQCGGQPTGANPPPRK
jgi:hypothetical protein